MEMSVTGLNIVRKIADVLKMWIINESVSDSVYEKLKAFKVLLI